MKNKACWLLRCVAASLLFAVALPASALDMKPWYSHLGLGSSNETVEVQNRAYNEIRSYLRSLGENPFDPAAAYGHFSGLGEFSESFGAKMLRAHLAKEAGFLQDSEKIYRDMMENNLANPWILNGLGYLLADQAGREDEALELLERAVKLAPDRYEIVSSLAWVLYRQGRLEEADARMDEARSLEWSEYTGYDHIELLAQAGEIKWELGLKDDAYLLWRAAAKEDGDNPALQDTMRRYGLDAFGKWRERASSYGPYLYDEPPEVAYDYLRSYLFLAGGPDREDLQKLVRLAREAKLLDEAEKHYRELMVFEPDQTENYYELGLLMTDKGENLSGALEVLRKGLDIAPGDFGLLTAYAWALHQSGDAEGGLEAMEEAQVHYDDQYGAAYFKFQALVRRGAMLWELGRKQEAVDSWREAWVLGEDDHYEDWAWEERSWKDYAEYDIDRQSWEIEIISGFLERYGLLEPQALGNFPVKAAAE